MLELGLSTIGDVAAADAALLAQLGKVGAVFQALARAEDPRRVQATRRAKSISSERTLSSDVSAPDDIRQQLRAAAESVGRRLRKHGLVARGVRVKLKRSDFRLLTRQRVLRDGTDQSERIYRTATELLQEFDDPGPFRLVGVGAYGLESGAGERQLDLLSPRDGARTTTLETLLDALDARFGRGIVQRAANLMGPTRIGPEVNLDFLDEQEEEGREDGSREDGVRPQEGSDPI